MMKQMRKWAVPILILGVLGFRSGVHAALVGRPACAYGARAGRAASGDHVHESRRGLVGDWAVAIHHRNTRPEAALRPYFRGCRGPGAAACSAFGCLTAR